MLVSDETGRGVVDATALTRDPEVIEAVSALNSELERAARPVVAATTPVSSADASAPAPLESSRHEERPTVYGRTGQETEDWAIYHRSSDSQIQAIDSQIAILRARVGEDPAGDRSRAEDRLHRPSSWARGRPAAANLGTGAPESAALPPLRREFDRDSLAMSAEKVLASCSVFSMILAEL